MNVLITGGLGYVGGRIADHLSRRAGCRVILTDLPLKAGPPAWAASYRFLPANVLDKGGLASVFAAEKIDAVIHLAALNDSECYGNPELATDVNTKGTYNVLEAASAAAVTRFIYFSTFHVYGPAAPEVISEAIPAMPAHPYGITHRAAEDFVNYFRVYKGMKTLIFRMSNSFGYPMDKSVNAWTLVFNDLCRQLMTTGSITLKSPGTQHRDFIALGDAVEAVRYFLFDIPDKWGDGLFNLGGGCSMSILDAARRVEKVYESEQGKPPGPMRVPAPGQPSPAAKPVVFSIEKIRAAGFIPVGDMDREIRGTLKLFR